MTREDINDIINAICPNDEDYEKPCISPKYLRQELEQLALDQRRWNEEPTTKNNLGVDREDAVERLNALKQLIGYDKDSEIVKATQKSLDMAIKALEQEPQTFKWCTGCREYDQEKHCCHRWSKAIRDTVEEMKQEYIEREVLNKIRAEIEQKIEAERFARSVFRGEEKDTFMAEQCTGSIFAYNNVIKLIDKYKAETEEKDTPKNMN